MKRPPSIHRTPATEETSINNQMMKGLRLLAGCFALASLLSGAAAPAQVITVDTSGNAKPSTSHAGTVDRRFEQIKPTQVPLSQTELDAKTRLELIRFLQADQGFAMRPLPMGHKGLALAANGKLEPAGEAYLSMVTANGICAKPGDRVVLTDVKIEKSRIVLLLNGGPDAKHRFLSHVEIGTGPMMSPAVQGDGTAPTGARLTLTFKEHIPELTGKEVEALLAPLISFEVKTPIQAFTDTLPPMLKDAILNHHVLVGMSTDMVLFAKGRPESKMREMDGQMPIEIWIYGKPPQDVDFVRINGNRVIRVEIAAVGKAVQVFTHDEVEGMMRTDGTPAVPVEASKTHTVEMGDVERNADTQAPATPPSLRNPGETLPADKTATDASGRVGVMKPVQFPKQKPDDETSATPDSQPDSAKPSDKTAPATAQSNSNTQSPPADASQPNPAKPAPAPSQPQ